MMEQDCRQFIDGLNERGLKANDEELWAAFYCTLKEQAQMRLRSLRWTNTLSATMLVNETYLKLGKGQDRLFNSPDHFLATASLAMRQIVLHYLREKRALKRGDLAVTLEDAVDKKLNHLDYDTVDRLIEDVKHVDPELANLIEARIFGGFTQEEIANAMGTSRRTVDRMWAKAKLILLHTLKTSG